MGLAVQSREEGVRERGGGDTQGIEGFSRCLGRGQRKKENQAACRGRQRGGGGVRGQREAGRLRRFGSEVAVVVAVPLARRASVVPPVSVAVPLVLPALPPGLVVVAAVAVGSPGWEEVEEEEQTAGRRQGGEQEQKTGRTFHWELGQGGAELLDESAAASTRGFSDGRPGVGWSWEKWISARQGQRQRLCGAFGCFERLRQTRLQASTN